MEAQINKALDAAWKIICDSDQVFKTPDNARGVPFTVYKSNDGSVWIKTGKKNNLSLRINKKAFFAALLYLKANQHGSDNKCEIASNTNPELAGPLCLATRKANTEDGSLGLRVITYIAPMLAATDLISLNGERPNKVWLK